ncbi:MAG: pyridoxamine 5'-phosphate oxidase family protein [Bacteroidota bacterium]|nr:pyridoxamine 5'-phosphate oxidase family protein [Bacteroidota bacterium]
MSEVLEVQPEVKEKILEILKSYDAIMVATTGGEYSPWILGAYFGYDDLKIYLLLETHGKSFANIQINNNVAISISKNDAMQDFLQGSGEAVILDVSEDKLARDLILEKMPSFQTYTPVTPVRIDVKKFFVTSLQNSWFPAKVLEV